MDAGRPILAPKSLKSIDDPMHCLSRLVCGTDRIKIPAHVLQFQNRMRERQKVREREELNRRLSSATAEREMLQARVIELHKKRSFDEANDTDSTDSSAESISTGDSLADSVNSGLSDSLDHTGELLIDSECMSAPENSSAGFDPSVSWCSRDDPVSCGTVDQTHPR